MTNKDDKVPQQQMSIEQAGNFLAEERTNEKQLKRIQEMDKPITVAPSRDREKFLEYAISLLSKSRYNEHKTLLLMRVKGYSTKEIAFYFKVHENMVLYLEKQAMKIVSDIIRATRENSIPILETGGATH